MQHRENDKNTTVIPKEDLQSAASNNTIKGVLTRVYKFFMVSFGKDRTPVWNKLMDMYVNDPSNNVPGDRARQTSFKGNVKREYLGPQLSWPKFCEAMRFSQFKSLEIIFIATDENGQKMKLNEHLKFDEITDLDFTEGFIDKHVKKINEEQIFEKIETSDARLSSVQPTSRLMTRGRDWITIPQDEVQSIINDNTIKPEDVPF